MVLLPVSFVELIAEGTVKRSLGAEEAIFKTSFTDRHVGRILVFFFSATGMLMGSVQERKMIERSLAE